MDLVRPSRMTFPEGTVLYSQSSRSQAVPSLGIVAAPVAWVCGLTPGAVP